MAGYINNPEETNKVIEEIDGVCHLHTGDIGHIDENGCIYIVYRIKRKLGEPGRAIIINYFDEQSENLNGCARTLRLD